jgi:hypothetical protein
LRTWLRIVKAAAAPTFIEGNTPAIGVRAGLAAAPHQPGEAEADIRGHIGAHAEKFTHRGK